MKEQTVPEMADGGYWYVVGVVLDPESGAYIPKDIPRIGWCAWYSEGAAAVRTVEIISTITTVESTVSDIVSAKPYGRVGGK